MPVTPGGVLGFLMFLPGGAQPMRSAVPVAYSLPFVQRLGAETRTVAHSMEFRGDSYC